MQSAANACLGTTPWPVKLVLHCLWTEIRAFYRLLAADLARSRYQILHMRPFNRRNRVVIGFQSRCKRQQSYQTQTIGFQSASNRLPIPLQTPAISWNADNRLSIALQTPCKPQQSHQTLTIGFQSRCKRLQSHQTPPITLQSRTITYNQIHILVENFKFYLFILGLLFLSNCKVKVKLFHWQGEVKNIFLSFEPRCPPPNYVIK